jgi:hypothetical protein
VLYKTFSKLLNFFFFNQAQISRPTKKLQAKQVLSKQVVRKKKAAELVNHHG